MNADRHAHRPRRPRPSEAAGQQRGQAPRPSAQPRPWRRRRNAGIVDGAAQRGVRSFALFARPAVVYRGGLARLCLRVRGGAAQLYIRCCSHAPISNRKHCSKVGAPCSKVGAARPRCSSSRWCSKVGARSVLQRWSTVLAVGAPRLEQAPRVCCSNVGARCSNVGAALLMKMASDEHGGIYRRADRKRRARRNI